MIKYLVLLIAIYLDLVVRHTGLLSLIFFTGICLVSLMLLLEMEPKLLFKLVLPVSVLYGIFLQQNLGVILVAMALMVLVYRLTPKILRELLVSLGFFSIFLLVSGAGGELDRLLFSLVLNSLLVLVLTYVVRRSLGVGRSSLALK